MTVATTFTPLEGGCSCGKVRFRLQAAPIMTHCCHCRFCQRSSGSAFAINTMIETPHVQLLQGEAEAFEAPRGQKVLHCPHCHTHLWAFLPMFGEAIAFMGVGILDEGERLTPEAHYFTRSRHPWVTLPPGLPAFEELGDPGKPEATARIRAAMAAANRAAPPAAMS